MLYVGLAGPACNFVLMAVAAVGARFAYHSVSGSFATITDLPLGVQLLFWFAYANLLLGVFNLLPIPPLDGSSLIERVLPADWLPTWYKIRPYGMLILILLVFSGLNLFGRILDPFVNRLFDFVFT